MLEYNWTRLLNKCIHAVTRYFFLLFQYLMNYTFFLKKDDDHGFLSYTKYYLSKKNSSRRWCRLGLRLVKNLTFSYKIAVFCNSKHFLQKIMTPCYSYHFCIFYIFNFFQVIMVSLFLAFHDQCSIMFKACVRYF